MIVVQSDNGADDEPTWLGLDMEVCKMRGGVRVRYAILK